MKIFIDHSESRSGTRLPANVIQNATVIVGLEHHTGADLILSPLDRPLFETICPTSLRMLQLHCRAGLLVQRKSGGDFINSIPKLPEIQQRMQQHGLAWLLITGRIECNAKEKAVIDKRTTGYSYWAIHGALDAWQLRGGGVTILTQDGQIAKWLSDQARRLLDCSEPALILPQKMKQTLIKEDELSQVVATLMTLPRIGGTTAVAIARQYGGLRAALKMLGDPNVLKDKDRPAGVGPKLIEEFRRVMQLKEGERL